MMAMPDGENMHCRSKRCLSARCPAAATRHGPAAFTLVELLVVIAIIGVLIAITLPSLSRARERAKRSVCLSNLHQTHLAFLYYAAENHGQAPLGYRSASKQFNSMIYSATSGQWVLFGLLRRGGYQTNPLAWYCKSEQNTKFMYNTVDNPWPAGWPTLNIQAGYACRPERQIPDDLGNPGGSFVAPYLPQMEDFDMKAIFSDLTAAANRVATRHREGVNVLFGNGSARWVPLALFNQPADQWPEPVNPPAPTFNGTQDLIWNAFDKN